MWVRGCFAILCDICLLSWKKSDPSLVFGLSMRYKGNSIWNILVSYSEKKTPNNSDLKRDFHVLFCLLYQQFTTQHSHHTLYQQHRDDPCPPLTNTTRTHTGNKRKCTPSSLYASRAVGCKARWKITDVLLGSWRSFSQPHTYVLTSRLRICN